MSTASYLTFQSHDRTWVECNSEAVHSHHRKSLHVTQLQGPIVPSVYPLVSVLVCESLCINRTPLLSDFMDLSLTNGKHQQEIKVGGERGIKLFSFPAQHLHPDLKLAETAFQAAALAKWPSLIVTTTDLLIISGNSYLPLLYRAWG